MRGGEPIRRAIEVEKRKRIKNKTHVVGRLGDVREVGNSHCECGGVVVVDLKMERRGGENERNGKQKRWRERGAREEIEVALIWWPAGRSKGEPVDETEGRGCDNKI